MPAHCWLATPAFCTYVKRQKDQAILWTPTRLLTFITLQEVGASSRAADEWCRGDSTPLARGDRQRFPYAVVEIKLQGVGQPAWIRRLVDSGG